MNVLRGSMTLAMTLCLLSLATPGFAAFQASDLMIVPVAAYTADETVDAWGTDVFITNVDEEAIDVSIYFFPSVSSNNYSFFNRRNYGLGGRSSEEFKYVDEQLADIPPNGTVILEQPLATWSDDLASQASQGALVIFAYTAGSLDDRDNFPDGVEYRNITVSSRTYYRTTIFEEDEDNPGTYVEKDVTYGQTIPGVPWYNLADGGYTDLSYQYLIGASYTEDTRFNFGIFNASDPLTSLSIAIEFYKANGEPYEDEDGDQIMWYEFLGPLTHVQQNGLLSVSGIPEGETGVLLKVKLLSWTTGSVPESTRPMFTCYGSIVDVSSNDATTVLPTFGGPYDVDCMWQTQDDSTAKKPTIGEELRERIAGGLRPLTAP